MMLVVPTVWIFFMLYQGPGHETFSWMQGFALLLVIIGTMWYIKSDREGADEDATTVNAN